jgi:hypothetical protein
MFAASALAANVPFQPFDSPKVTLDQWTGYHEAVKAAFGATVQERPAEHAIMYLDESTQTQYIFTTPSNAAHPGWISRRLVKTSGASSIEQVGYFAGSLEAFTLWFQTYQEANERWGQKQ